MENNLDEILADFMEAIEEFGSEVEGTPTKEEMERLDRIYDRTKDCLLQFFTSPSTPETLPNSDVTKLEDRPDVKLAIDKAVAEAFTIAWNKLPQARTIDGTAYYVAHEIDSLIGGLGTKPIAALQLNKEENK